MLGINWKYNVDIKDRQHLAVINQKQDDTKYYARLYKAGLAWCICIKACLDYVTI
jgi:hypothetical protein